MSQSPPLTTAQARIADCLLRGRDHLNLADLGLTNAELEASFDFEGETMSFAQLTALRYLDLTGNRLTELPECVGRFTGLVWLGLNFNRLTTVNGVVKLKRLQRLYLRGNLLVSMPEQIGVLSSLVELDLCDNKIIGLPDSLLNLLDENRDAGQLYFDLSQNYSSLSALVNSAEGIMAKRRALANYLSALAEASEVVAQGKLLLVGEGGAGKTTLLDVLTGKAYDKNSDTTHGLELRPLILNADEGWAGVLHAWDFSGQPAMRQTHQLFFTTPALYVLVWNHREARDEETTTEIMEWLTLIDQRTQGEGRVLLIAKKAKDRSAEPPGAGEILRRFGYNSKPDNEGILLNVPFLKVDSEGDQAEQQIQTLRQRIAAFAAAMPNFNERRPVSWIKAQQHFQGRRIETPYLGWGDFSDKIKLFRISDAEEYARVQHRLGTMVWLDTERMRHLELRDGEQPQQIVVLNPDWLSKAIGFVIERDDKDRRANDTAVPDSPPDVATGLVSEAQMDAIWSAPPQPKKGDPLVFPKSLFSFFRQLMRAFDIAKPVRHEGTHAGGWYLIPNRLQDTQPTTWQNVWREDLPQVFWRVELRGEQDEPLNHWLGLAIFFRLMIMLHGEALGRQDFRHAGHWRRGFILAPQSGGMARVEFNGSDRKDAARCVGFDIQVASHQPRDVWPIFANMLNCLLYDLERHYGYAAIKVVRLISCPSNLCDRPQGRRCFIDEGIVAACAHSGDKGWKQQSTICNASGCGKKLPMGLLWEGRVTDDRGRLEKIEGLLGEMKAVSIATYDQIVDVHRDFRSAFRSMASLHDELSDIRVRLDASALASERSIESILKGDQALAKGLRLDMERMQEELWARLRHFHLYLADPHSDLPRFYTLKPVEGWRVPFTTKKWRLWLHCEKTGYPAKLLTDDGKGEFIIPESQEFLKTVAPYVKSLSIILAGLAPIAALLTNATPVAAVTPAALLGLAKWAKDFENPTGSLAMMLKDTSKTDASGMVETSDLPTYAESEGLMWLHNYLRKDPTNRSKLGLQAKRDSQGKVWWVLPHVEV